MLLLIPISSYKKILVTWAEFILKAGCEVVHPVLSPPTLAFKHITIKDWPLDEVRWSQVKKQT